MHGLGKQRSMFGSFLDSHSISQEEFAKKSNISRSTISRLAQPDQPDPTLKTAKKIIKTLKDSGFDITYDDFWCM